MACSSVSCPSTRAGTSVKIATAARCFDAIEDLNRLAAEAGLDPAWVDEDIELLLSMSLDFGASTNHHHLEPGGLALHSCEVAHLALQEINLWSSDTNARYLAFVLGLFDDVGKVFCYDLRCRKCEDEFTLRDGRSTEDFFNEHSLGEITVIRDRTLGPKAHEPMSQVFIERLLLRRGVLIGSEEATRKAFEAVRRADRVSVARYREQVHRDIVNRQLADPACREFYVLPEYASYVLTALDELARLGLAQVGRNVWRFKDFVLVEFDEFFPLVAGFIRARYGSMCERARGEAASPQKLMKALWGEGRLLCAGDTLDYWVALMIDRVPLRVLVLARQVYGKRAILGEDGNMFEPELRSPTGRTLKSLKTIDRPKYSLNGEAAVM